MVSARRMFPMGLALGIMLMVTGCGSDLATKDVQEVEVLTIGKESVCLDEVYIYAETVKQEYEHNYGSGIWAVKLNNDDGKVQTIEEITREDLIEEIVQVKVLSANADQFGVALTQEENAKIEEQATAFIAGLTDQEIHDTGVTKELAVQVYEENAIASKVFDRIMVAGQVEVSEEDSRQTKIYDMVFPLYSGEGENIKPLSEDEAEAEKIRADEAYGRITAAENPLNIEAAAYEYGCGESREYTMDYAGYCAQYGDAVTEQIFSLQDGGISPVLQSEYGYHIIQMIAVNDREATAAKKQELTEKLQREYFEEVFEKYLKELDSNWKFSKNVDEEAFNLIRFVQEDVQTDSTQE